MKLVTSESLPESGPRFENYAPDRETAERFITAITGSLDTRLAWLFHDTKELVEKHGFGPMSKRTNPPVFPGEAYGTLAEVWDRIVATQAAGGAVSLRVNIRPPDANGCCGGLDVYHFRALYLDLDFDNAEMKAKLDKMNACPQTVLVKSRRAGHLYWALDNNREYNVIPEAEWRAAQAALTEHFGGDQSLKLPGSQLRLPGTWNFKDPAKPHLLTAFIAPERRYAASEVLARFNLKPVGPPARREPRPLSGELGEAVKNWLADHGQELEVRKHTRCPVCDGDGGCKPYGEDQTRLICFSSHHEATGIGTQVGTGFVFSALDITRGDIPLPVFLRREKNDDGNPYYLEEREDGRNEDDQNEDHKTRFADWYETLKRIREKKAAVEQAQPEQQKDGQGTGDDKAYAEFACRVSEVKEELIDWVTPGWVARGKLHIVEGDKGCAKSTVTLDLIASLSRGRGWLGGCARPPANALILAPEDGIADTIRPRLRAADADLERVFVQRFDAATPVFPAIVPFLEQFIIHKQVQFLAIDSLMSCLGNLNSHRDQDVRNALMPLRAMLERTGCTAFAIRHLNKNVGAAAGHRGMGSVAFAAIARVVWLLARDPAAEEQFVLTRSMGNLGRTPKSRMYSLRASSPESSDVHIVWGAETDRTAEDLVAKPDGGPRARGKDAEGFLRELLADGPMPVKDLVRIAQEKGIARATLYRARWFMSIDATNGVWRLRPEDQPTPQAAELQRAIEPARAMT